jgi:hypothetical protein
VERGSRRDVQAAARKSAAELGNTSQGKTCPDIWELSNGDIAIVGTDMTEAFADRIPGDMAIGAHERLVVIPRNMLVAARPEIPDA